MSVIGTMELDEEVALRRSRHTSRESEVVMDARARLASRVRKISDEGRKLVAASIARIARKLGHNARGIKFGGIDYSIQFSHFQS